MSTNKKTKAELQKQLEKNQKVIAKQKSFSVQSDWRFKAGIFFVAVGIIFSSAMLYFPPPEAKNGEVEISSNGKKAKFPVHQLPPILSVGTGTCLFIWLFLARRHQRKLKYGK